MEMKKSPLLKRGSENTVKKTVLLSYTAIFAVFAAVVFCLFFLRYDRSLILAPDALSQHVGVLGYYGEYLRTILRNIFVEHTFEIPMFDFSIGMGYDIVATLHYYGVGDPLNLLSVFVPLEYTEYLYCFIAVLRMYLSGLAFAFYILHRKTDSTAVVMSAFAYAFSGFCMRAATIHPFFLTGLLYCPLIFLGIDLILEKKSPVLYISSVALIVVTNFYFAYMTCIMMLIYAAMRYFPAYGKKGAKHFFGTIGKFAVYTVNGFLLSMIIFLPQIVNVLSVDRLNVKNLVTAFYNPSYYQTLVDAVTNPNAGSHWVAIGYTGISLLGILVCFIRAKKNKNVVISFCLSLVAVSFPVFGHIFNGFTYVVNRWIWIMAFIGCVALTTVFDQLLEFTLSEKKKLIAVALAYVVFAFYASGEISAISMLMLVIMFAAIGVALVAGTEMLSIKSARGLICILLVMSVFMQYSNRCSTDRSDWKSYVRLGDYYTIAHDNTVAALVNKVDDGSEFFRYDDNNNAVNENAALLADTNSTAFYYSISNVNISKFIKEIGLNSPIEQRTLNFDDRTLLQSLTGCRYVSGAVGIAKLLLYSRLDEELVFQNNAAVDVSNLEIDYYKSYFSHEAMKEAVLRLNELKYALPLGYTYDSVMSREEYEKLTPAEKQNVLLQTAVTDGAVSLPAADIRTEGLVQTDIFELIKNGAEIPEGIEISGNSVIVKDTSAGIVLDVQVPMYSEYYMLVDGLDFKDISPYIALREEMSEVLEYQQEKIDKEALANGTENKRVADFDPVTLEKLAEAERNYNSIGSTNIFVASKLLNHSVNITYYTPKNQFYTGFNTFMANIGSTLFSDEENSAEFLEDTVVITFDKPGVYNMDNWMLCWQSLDYVDDDYRARTENVLENVEVSDSENTVKGTVSLEEPRILATQIPYSEGWSVTVDGKEAELLNVNTMFCGVMLDEGVHTIEFNYVTPNANLAVILTAAGIAQLVATVVIFRFIRKKRTAEGVEK